MPHDPHLSSGPCSPPRRGPTAYPQLHTREAACRVMLCPWSLAPLPPRRPTAYPATVHPHAHDPVVMRCSREPHATAASPIGIAHRTTAPYPYVDSSPRGRSTPWTTA